MSSNPEYAIDVNNLSKCYKLYNNPSDRLRQALPWNVDKTFYHEFWALRNVSFRLQKGETLGVIGRNGAGKSTLLQLICGTLMPSSGSISVTGRIGALLELGSGFNPDFTGLDNVRFNAAVLGFTDREIDQKLDSIIAFADIGKFIEQPVKNYSTGMIVRLAFAVQAHIDPAVLIVDEALAVGDEIFQRKCFKRLSDLKENGTSIVLVSHSCTQINQNCTQVLLLSKGRKLLHGKPALITAIYQRLPPELEHDWEKIIQTDINIKGSPSNAGHHGEEETNDQITAGKSTHEESVPPTRYIYPERGAKIVSIKTQDGTGQNTSTIKYLSPFSINVTIVFSEAFRNIALSTFIANKQGVKICGQSYPFNSEQNGFRTEAGKSYNVTFECNNILYPGTYYIGFGLVDRDKAEFIHRIIDAIILKIESNIQIPAVGDTFCGNKSGIIAIKEI